MSINDLNNLYDTIVNENKLSESEELNDRVKNLMLLIKRAHKNQKRWVVLPYLETDIKALLRKVILILRSNVFQTVDKRIGYIGEL